MKKYFLVITIFVILLSSLFQVKLKETLQQKEISLHARAYKASQEGANWLLNYEQNYKDPAILWILNIVNEKYCKSKKIDNFIESKFDKEFKFSLNLKEKWYERLWNRNLTRIPDDSVFKPTGAIFDDILLPALYCDLHAVDEETSKKISDFSSSNGYYLTHQFIALLIMKQNNCLDGWHKDLIPVMAEKISREINHNFSDLSVERVAFLEYGNFSNKIRTSSIENIIKNQLPSGGWPNIKRDGSPHTTGLAIWALAEYTKTCPFSY